MSIKAMKQALEALENAWLDASMGKGDVARHTAAITYLRQAIAEAEKKNNGKLKVTLQDTPTEIELAQYKRMFEAACSALGAVGDALGVDPEEGGAEPIIAAIQELKAEKQEPVAWNEWTNIAVQNLMRHGLSKFDARQMAVFLKDKAPQRQWVGLTDDEIDQNLLRSDYAMQSAHAWRAGVVFAMTQLKEKNT